MRHCRLLFGLRTERWLRELAEKRNCRFAFASGSLAKFWENREMIDRPAVVPEIMPPQLKWTPDLGPAG